jgi:hypothetical protein
VIQATSKNLKLISASVLLKKGQKGPLSSINVEHRSFTCVVESEMSEDSKGSLSCGIVSKLQRASFSSHDWKGKHDKVIKVNQEVDLKMLFHSQRRCWFIGSSELEQSQEIKFDDADPFIGEEVKLDDLAA